jgi:hypothetical protein
MSSRKPLGSIYVNHLHMHNARTRTMPRSVRKSLSQRRSVACHADDTGYDFLSKPTDDTTLRSSKKRKRHDKTKRPRSTESAPSHSKRQRRDAPILHEGATSKHRAKPGPRKESDAREDMARGSKVPGTIVVVVPAQTSLITSKMKKALDISKASRSSKKQKRHNKSKRHGTTQLVPPSSKRQCRNGQTQEGHRAKSGSMAHTDHAMVRTTTNRKAVTWKDAARGGKVEPPVSGVPVVPMQASLASLQLKKACNEPRGPIVSKAARPSDKHGTSCNPNDTLNRRCSTGSIVLSHTNKKQGRQTLSVPSGSARSPINLVESAKKVPTISCATICNKRVENARLPQRGEAVGQQRVKHGNVASGYDPKRETVASQQWANKVEHEVHAPLVTGASEQTTEQPEPFLIEGHCVICVLCRMEIKKPTAAFRECLCKRSVPRVLAREREHGFPESCLVTCTIPCDSDN